MERGRSKGDTENREGRETEKEEIRSLIEEHQSKVSKVDAGDRGKEKMATLNCRKKTGKAGIEKGKELVLNV